MYCFIYGRELSERRYEQNLLAIENRLSDLDLSGSVIRLHDCRNLSLSLAEQKKRGVSTFVVLGNQTAFFESFEALMQTEQPIGYIPFSTNELSLYLGVPPLVQACDVLSARTTELMDVGLVNNHPFLLQFELKGFEGKVHCGDSYTCSPKSPALVRIKNTSPADASRDQLEMTLDVSYSTGWSLFSRKQVTHTSIIRDDFVIEATKQSQAALDGELFEGTQFTCSIRKKAVRLIAGKDRLFSTPLVSLS